MKNVILAVFALVAISASAQTVKFNAYYSTNKTHLVGGDLLLIHHKGVVAGIGGSHASTTFFTSEQRNGNDYTDNSNNIASNFPKLSNPANAGYIREVFTEDRGTVYALVGYCVSNSTIIYADFGICLQQQIKLATTGVKSNPITPHNTNYWESQTTGPIGLIGITIDQRFSNRWGILLGYSNITQFKFGLTYKITPTSMFK